MMSGIRLKLPRFKRERGSSVMKRPLPGFSITGAAR